MTPGHCCWCWELSLPLFTLLPLMDGRSPHQALFLSLPPGAGKWCCHPCGGRRQAGLSLVCLPFPGAMGYQLRNGHGQSPHHTEFVFSRFITMLPSSFPRSFIFQNTSRCVASFYVTLSWQPSISPGSNWECRSPSWGGAILPSSAFVTQLSFRKELVWITRRCGCFLHES